MFIQVTNAWLALTRKHNSKDPGQEIKRILSVEAVPLSSSQNYMVILLKVDTNG